MTANEKLDKFMKLKQEVLNEKPEFIGSGYSYYTKQDRNTIMSWSPDKAQAIWNRIKLETEISELYTFSGDICPFCIYNSDNNCSKCNYSGKDTVCGHSTRLFFILEEAEVIRKLIKKIEKED